MISAMDVFWAETPIASVKSSIGVDLVVIRVLLLVLYHVGSNTIFENSSDRGVMITVYTLKLPFYTMMSNTIFENASDRGVKRVVFVVVVLF